MEIQTALDQARVLLNRKLAERERLSAEIESLESEVRGLQLAQHRLTQGASLASEEEPASGWESMKRTDAILRALRILQRASPSDLEGYFSEVGRDDASPYISAALSYLKHQGRVTNPARGSWTLLESSEESVEEAVDL